MHTENIQVPSLNDAVDDLSLDVFELTEEGFQVESLTGTNAFSGRTGCCCSSGSSTTCQTVTCICFC